MKPKQANILIGCDSSYHNDWGVNLLTSIHVHNPYVKLHAHVVNPNGVEELPFVDYTYEEKEFVSEENRIGYLQCCRFLAVSKKFPNKEYVMTLDADSICTRPFTLKSFIQVAKQVTVLHHYKQKRWLAGLVTYGKEDFRHALVKKLNERPYQEWRPFHDQTCLASLSEKYDFQKEHSEYKWMSIGKSRKGSVFLTLKGRQKVTEKYLQFYNRCLGNVEKILEYSTENTESQEPPK